MCSVLPLDGVQMPSLRSLLLFGLSLLSVVSARSDDGSVADHSAAAEWEETLKALPGESLEAALEHNLRPKYQGGVFEDTRSALAAVRSDDPELASKLVDMAKQDAKIKDYLRKRQNNSTVTSVTSTTSSSAIVDPGVTSTSTTTTTTTPSPVSSPSVSSASSTPGSTGVLVPIGVTTTIDGSVAASTSLVLQPSAPTSVSVDVTTTNDQGSMVVSAITTPAVVMSMTDAQGSVRTTFVPVTSVAVGPGGSITSIDAPLVTSTDDSGGQLVLTSPTPGGVYTPSDSAGNVVTVTYRPGGGTVSSLVLKTTTLPDGMQTVITALTAVPGGTAPAAGAEGAQGTNKPGLQSGAAAPSSWYAAEVALVVGAAIGVAGLVL